MFLVMDVVVPSCCNVERGQLIFVAKTFIDWGQFCEPVAAFDKTLRAKSRGLIVRGHDYCGNKIATSE